MSDLDIVIKVAVGNAIAELQRTTAETRKAETAFSSFAATFARIAQYEKAMAAEMAAAREKVDNLSGSFKKMADAMRGETLVAVGKAFAGLTEQIKREADMLERLHAPMKQAIQDHQTLEMLQKRGAVTTQQYAQEMARLHNQNNPVAASNGMKPSMLSSMGGMGGTVGALVGVGTTKAVLDLGDTYISLENRLRTVAKSQGELNHLMEATKGIADRTRSDWGATAESFVRLTNATKSLGVSQERALRLQETLNMALQSSGASSSEAASGTLQLMQALSAGALQGDEFRSISESLPGLMDIFAKQLGVTRGELKKMGAEGKITTDIVVKGLESASGSIRDQFMASTATASQQWTVFKNQLTESAGEFVKNSNIIQTLGGALSSIGSIIGPIGSLLGGLTGIVSNLGDAIGLKLNVGIGTLVGMAVGGPLGAAIGTFAEGVIRADSGVTDWANSMQRLFAGLPPLNSALDAFNAGVASVQPALITLDDSLAGLVARLNLLPGALENVNKKMGTTTALAGALALFVATNKVMKDATDQLEAQGEQLKKIRGPQIAYHREVDALNQLLDTNQISQATFNTQLKEIEARYDKLANGVKKYTEAIHLAWEAEQRFSGNYGTGNQPKSNNLFTGKSEFAIGAVGSDSQYGAVAGESKDNASDMFAVQRIGMTDADNNIVAYQKKYNEELAKTKVRFENISTALQPMEDGFNRLFTTGKFGFKQMMDEWWSMLTRMATHKLFTTLASGLANAGGGGAGTEAAGMAAVAAASGGNHAFGGSYTAPWTGGGQDSVPVMFRMSPGEHVQFTPQAGPPSGGGGQAPPTAPMQAIVEYHHDPRALRIGDPNAVRFVLDVARQHPGAFGRG